MRGIRKTCVECQNVEPHLANFKCKPQICWSLKSLKILTNYVK